MFSGIKIPSHLPEKLTISFPIWGLHDTPGNGAYHDPDRMMYEHAERGFNCIRLDDGAGAVHDRSGRRRGSVTLGPAFGEYSRALRQWECGGDGGECDLLRRLIELCSAAKKQGIYLILSSWYFLHTYWIIRDEALNDALFAIPPHERFRAFAEFLDYILCKIEDRGLSDRIAFVEIFNEADGLGFAGGYGHTKDRPRAEMERFHAEHDEAISWLRSRHGQILFAYDTSTPYIDAEQIPQSMQVFNFHNYFLWDIYTEFERCGEAAGMMHADCASLDAVRRSRDGFYSGLDPMKLGAAEKWFDNRFAETRGRYYGELERSLRQVGELSKKHFPGVPIVCGEGVTYCGAKALLWEERSEPYWALVEHMIRRYRECGLWGTVIRTCCGPEDPVWRMCPDKLRRLNRLFLGK